MRITIWSWGFLVIGMGSLISLLLVWFQQENLVLLNNLAVGNDLESEIIIFAFCLFWSILGIVGMKVKSRLLVNLSILAMLICSGYLAILTVGIGLNLFHFYFCLLLVFGFYVWLNPSVRVQLRN